MRQRCSRQAHPLDRIYTPEDNSIDIDDETDAAESSNPDPNQPCPLQYDAMIQCSLDSREDLLWPSDHRPVTLTVSTLARPQPVSPRIQRKLLFNDDLRKEINTIIEKFFPVTISTDTNGKIKGRMSIDVAMLVTQQITFATCALV